MVTVANLGTSYIQVFFVLFAPFCKIVSKEKFFFKRAKIKMVTNDKYFGN